MIGAQGSGKSTLAKSLKEKYGGYIVSADEYWTMDNGDYIFVPQKLKDAHTWAFSHFQYHVFRRRNIYVDNTNANWTDLVKYADHALLNDYSVSVLEPETSWRYSLEELYVRNLHNVPKEAIERTLNNLKFTLNVVENNSKYGDQIKKVSVEEISKILAGENNV